MPPLGNPMLDAMGGGGMPPGAPPMGPDPSMGGGMPPGPGMDPMGGGMGMGAPPPNAPIGAVFPSTTVEGLMAGMQPAAQMVQQDGQMFDQLRHQSLLQAMMQFAGLLPNPAAAEAGVSPGPIGAPAMDPTEQFGNPAVGGGPDPAQQLY